MSSGSLTGSLRETLAVFGAEAGVPMTTNEVADALDLGRRSTYARLDRLVELDRIETKKVGAGGRVWWRPQEAATAPSAGSVARSADGREQFESLVDAVEEYALFLLDAEGRIATWNEGAKRIKGYLAAEIVGERIDAFYTPADRRADVPDRNLADAAARGSVEDEGWRVRADGSRFWANVTITALRGDDGELRGYAKVTRDMTERREREQELRRERDLVERVLEASPSLIGVFDAGSRELLRANEALVEFFGGIRGDGSGGYEYVAGDVPIYDPDGELVPRDDRPYAWVSETGEPVYDWQCQMVRADGVRRWFSINSMPLVEDGRVEQVVVVGDDVTRLTEQARQLERQRDDLRSELDEISSRVTDAFFGLDDDGRFAYVGEHAEELLGRDAADLVGENLDAAPEIGDLLPCERYERAMERQEDAAFEAFYRPRDAWFEVRVYPSETGLSVYFRDVSERKERETELERYRVIVEAVGDAIYVADENQRFTMVNHAATTLSGYPREEIVGAPVADFIGEAGARRAVELADALATDERNVAIADFDLRTADGREVPIEVRFTHFPSEDGGVDRVGVARDVSERRRRERELEEYRRWNETLVENFPGGAVAIVDRAFRYVTFGGTPQGDTDLTRADLEGADVRDVLPARIADVVVPRYEAALDGVPSEFEDTVDGRICQFHFVPIRDDDGEVFAAAATSQDITDRRERERQVEAQREHLAALNHLNGVVHEITDAAIDRSTREEIERTVCEALAASESYAFAWIGETDPATETVRLRTEAGVEGYLDGVTISVDPNEPEANGPTATAVRTGEMQVVTDAPADYDVEEWRAHAAKHGFRSAASIPIAHEGVHYGTLNVYAPRPGAFADEERAVVGRLGEVVGHAIAAVERKRALTSDQVHEIDFRIPDVFSAYDIPTAAADRITLDQAVPIGDGEYLVYGTATDEDMAAVDAIVDTLPTWESVRVLGAGFGRTKFELLLSESSILNSTASHNGYVEGAWIEDGDYHMRVQLPHGVDVRQFIDAALAAYPMAELRAQRQVRRSDVGANRMTSAIEVELTERQRTALETAHFAGYFEWPRESNGGDLADALGISAPTFSQHLRTAEKKVFEALFDSLPPSA